MAADRSGVGANQVVAVVDYPAVALGVSEAGDYRTGVGAGDSACEVKRVVGVADAQGNATLSR